MPAWPAGPSLAPLTPDPEIVAHSDFRPPLSLHRLGALECSALQPGPFPELGGMIIRRARPSGSVRQAHFTCWLARAVRGGNLARRGARPNSGANSTCLERAAAASPANCRHARVPQISFRCRSLTLRKSASNSLAALTPSQQHDLKGKNLERLAWISIADIGES